jgi:alkylation response protein AidB-like acyl-CoA dehydrogenase
VTAPSRAGLAPAELATELREFLAGHHPGRAPREGRLAFLRAWQATLADHGWAAPGWPRRWGGMELPLHLQAVYHREMAAGRAPVPPSSFAGIVGPTVLLHGTDEQRERWMRPLIRADELWCQGFSEPDAGSDLGSLRTRATPDGEGGYRVTGRKVWTSGATTADRMLLLARTGPPGSGTRGITCLAVDMRAPGVRARPLRDMTGGAHFAEVELDDVAVPATDRIGPEGQGWTVARATMGHERSTSLAASGQRYRRIAGDLVELARRHGRADDPRVRQRLAEAITGARLLEWGGRRVLARVLAEPGPGGGAAGVAGGPGAAAAARSGAGPAEGPGPLSSVMRLQHGLFEQRLHELAADLLGDAAVLDPAALDRRDAAWLRGFLRTRASTIGAGTAEIQRNTIAEKVLGLPAPREEAG